MGGVATDEKAAIELDQAPGVHQQPLLKMKFSRSNIIAFLAIYPLRAIVSHA